MRWYWWLAAVWIGGPMIFIPSWYLLRRLLPIPAAERIASDAGEMRALRKWRAAGSPRRWRLGDPGEDQSP